MTQNTKLTKQERRELKKQKRAERRARQHETEPEVGISIKSFHPLTANQKKVFESYYNNKNLMLHGCAGTGKTFIAMYLSLQEILESDIYEKLIIIRSAQPSKDQGYLPGNLKEKTKIYESPYTAICSELFGRGNAYDLLKSKGKIEFHSTSYNRGVTFSNCIVLVDELQNLTAWECDTTITRLGDNSKIIFAGDIRQNDLIKPHEKSGIADFMKIIKRMNCFDTIEFGTEDIIRSRLVKSYIITRNELEDRREIKSLVI